MIKYKNISGRRGRELKGTIMIKLQKVSDNVMELDVEEVKKLQVKKEKTADKNKFQDLINANKTFKTLFIEPKSFVMATEKSVMINLFGLKFFVPQTMAKLNEKGAKGKTYSSITINREWTYKVWESKKVSKGVYENFNEQEVSGNDIVDWYYENLKQDK